MKTKTIQKIFKKEFNGYFNPIFNHPIMYFRHKNYMCEVAASQDLYQESRKKNIYAPFSLAYAVCLPLFCNQGYWITVLEKTSSGIAKRTDLDTHFDNWKKELNSFINTKLN